MLFVIQKQWDEILCLNMSGIIILNQEIATSAIFDGLLAMT